MDPVSLSASIAGLISLTLDLCKISHKFIIDVKHADRNAKDCVQALLSLQGVLIELQNINFEDSRILECEARLKDIKARIERELKRPKAVRRLTWPFKDDETRQTVAKLQSYRDDFHAILSVRTMLVSLNALEPHGLTDTYRSMASTAINDLKIEHQGIDLMGCIDASKEADKL